MKSFLSDIFGFLYTLSMGDYFFLVGTFLLIISLIYIIYLIKRDDLFVNEVKYDNNENKDTYDIIKICEKLETDYKPKNIELTGYEEEQENNAIISYEELIKNKNNYRFSYDDEYNYDNDEIRVKKIDLNSFEMSETKEKEIELKVKLMNYDKEEAFLKALKQLQINLVN